MMDSVVIFKLELLKKIKRRLDLSLLGVSFVIVLCLMDF